MDGEVEALKGLAFKSSTNEGQVSDKGLILEDEADIGLTRRSRVKEILSLASARLSRRNIAARAGCTRRFPQGRS